MLSFYFQSSSVRMGNRKRKHPVRREPSPAPVATQVEPEPPAVDEPDANSLARKFRRAAKREARRLRELEVEAESAAILAAEVKRRRKEDRRSANSLVEPGSPVI